MKPSTNTVLTLDEIAKLIRVSVRTVRRLISRGELAAVRVGRQLRVRRDVFEAYMRRPGGVEKR